MRHCFKCIILEPEVLLLYLPRHPLFLPFLMDTVFLLNRGRSSMNKQMFTVLMKAKERSVGVSHRVQILVVRVSGEEDSNLTRM